MTKRKEKTEKSKSLVGLSKCPTSISGLDQITNGGLPQGRPTLVCGGAGSGKTLFAMEFLAKGATVFGEPGVFVAFEENIEELTQNVASLGIDITELVAQKKLVVDYVHVERSEIEGSGDYGLDGLFIRLGFAIDEIGAKRVVMDSIETLFTSLPNPDILRQELRRLFLWLKGKGVTAIITAERGDGELTRHGLEEYVSDCVILLEQRVVEQICTRRLRIVKYRGSAHGSDEYPFLLDEHGFTVVPLTSIGLQYEVSEEFISTGVSKLDEMLGGSGYYRGGTLLVSGTAGTGKTSLTARFVEAACQRGERCLYVAFEESPDQLMRNMQSIGVDLKKWVNKGLLRFEADRPSSYGLEMHLAKIQRASEHFQPHVVVLDPISSLEFAGGMLAAQSTLMRLVDFFKARKISAMFTSLTGGRTPVEQTDVGISSLIDTWLLVRNLEQGGERTRALYILKSRGIAHSNRVREFVLTDNGPDLLDVYVGPDGILTGSAREIQEMQDQAMVLRHAQSKERTQLVIERKRQALSAKIAELEMEFETEKHDMEIAIDDVDFSTNSLLKSRSAIAVSKRTGVKQKGTQSKTAKGRRK